MRTRIALVGVFFGLLSCTEGLNVKEIQTTEPTDKVIFGHLDSFMVNPDILFKLSGDTLYTTHHKATMDPLNPPAFERIIVSDSLLAAAKSLLLNLPSGLTSDQSVNVGTYFPDVGHAFVQIKSTGGERHWYIEGTTPPYLSGFASDLNQLIYKLPQ